MRLSCLINLVQHLTASGPLWSAIVNKPPVLPQYTVTHSAVLPARRLAVGTVKPAKLTASNKDKLWHVFVGKLDQDTSENDVFEHLAESSGIRVNKGTLMKPAKDWQRNSAAFRISIAFEDNMQCLIQVCGQ
jgi:hypothetical protein